MAKEDITAKFRVDISDLKKGITEANRNIKLANAEFKAASAGMDDWTKSSEGLRAKLKQLEAVIAEEDKKLEKYREQLKRVQEAEQENAKRVEDARKAYEKAKSQFGENSAEAKKYGKALNEVEQEQEANKRSAHDLNLKIAETEGTINKTKRQADGFSDSLKDVEEAEKRAAKSGNTVEQELKEIGNEAEKTESKLGKLAKGLAKGLAAGAAVAGTALVALTKSAIQGYGEYEQLVGGVETLFGASGQSIDEYAKSVGKSVDEVKDEYNNLMKSQQQVITNANDAYKTAGMSANEYMETVTSFSASLLQSVGGDTVKAAKAADTAIIDMADNANKMGTSMEMIQNAYQGFAKQNYTMLDNLKLGYGGTKTEMERLLADATKLSGVKYDINNLNDVYEAIHVIQTEIGITGTTAKEASSTIQGSTAAMKSAWTNLLTGVADENANFDQLLTNFIDSVGTFAENLIPRIGVVISKIPQLITGLLPEVVKLIQNVLPVLIDGIMSMLGELINALPKIVQAIVDVIPKITQGLLNALPLLVTAGIQIILALLDGLGQMLPEIVSQIIAIIPQIVQALIDGIPLLLQGAIQFLLAIIDAIPVLIQALVDNLPMIIQTIITTLIENIPLLIKGAIQLLMAIVQAIPQIVIEVAKAAPQIVTGLVKGLLDGVGELGKAALELGKSFLGGIKNFFGIKSPSTVMEAQGDFLVQGMINGLSAMPEKALEIFNNMFNQVQEWGSRLGQKSIEIATNFFNNIVSFIANLPSKISELLTDAFSKVTEWGSNMLSKAKTIGSDFVNKLMNILEELPSEMWNQFTKVLSKVTQWGTQMVSKGKTAASDLVKTVVTKVKEIPNGIANVGKNLVEGVWQGISNSTTWLKNKFKAWVGSPLKWAKEVLGIASPSTVFAKQIGEQIPAGVAEGVEQGSSKAAKAAEKMAKSTYDNAKTWIADYRNDSDYLASEEIKMWESLAKKYSAVSNEKVEIDKNIAKLKTKANKDEYAQSKLMIENYRNDSKYLASEEIKMWEELAKKYSSVSKEKVEIDKNIAKLKTQLNKEEYAQAKQRIANYKNDSNYLASEEMKMWQELAKNYTTISNEKIEIDKNIAKLKTQVEKEQFAQSKQMIEDKRNDTIASMRAEVEAWENVQSRYAVGTEVRKEADKELALAKKRLFEEEQSIVKKMEDAEAKYQKAVEDRAQSIYNTYGLFDELNKKETVASETLANNLKGQITQMQLWARNMKLLAARGVDEGLIEELQQMGSKANTEIRALVSMSDKELKEYTELWRTKHELARNQAVKELEGLRSETNDQIGTLLKELTSTVTTQSNPVGTNMVQGIIDGINNRSSALYATLKKMGDEAVAAVKSALDIKSPSRKFMELGEYTGEGFEIGLSNSMGKVKEALKDKLDFDFNTLANQFNFSSLGNKLTAQTAQLKTTLGQMVGKFSSDTAGMGRSITNSNTNNFTQIINAPKQPSRIELYRQTRNLMEFKFQGG